MKRRRKVQEGGGIIRICFIKLTKEARKLDKKKNKYIDKSFNRKEAEKAAEGREVIFIDRSRRIFSEKEKSLRV